MGLIRYFAAFAASPFGIQPDEGKWVYKAWLLRNGQTIYPDLAGYPFIVTLYPPVYFGVTAFVMLFAGPTMLAGRLVSILAAFSVGAALTALLRRETGQLLPSAVVAVLLISSPFMAEWGRVAKGDMLYLAFGLWGMHLFVSSQRSNDSRAAVVSALLFVAALYTKQPAVSLLISCVASAALRRRLTERSLVVFVLTLLLVATALFMLLQVATSGQFYQQAVASASRITDVWGWSPRTLLSWLIRFWDTYWAGIIASVLSLLLLLFDRGTRSQATHPLSLLLVAVAPFAWNLLGYGGADMKALLPLIVTVYWFVGLSVPRLERRHWWGPAAAAGLVLGAFLPLGRDAMFVWPRRPGLDWEPFLRDMNAIADMVRSSPGDVIVDEGSFSLLSGKPRLVELHGLQVYAGSGHAIPGLLTLIGDIEDRRFDLIIPPGGAPILEEVQPALAFAYELSETIRERQIFRPRPGYLIGITDFAAAPEHGDSEITMTEEGRSNAAVSAREPWLGRVAEGPGWITYRLEAPDMIRQLTVTGWPRVERSESANAVIAEWSSDGETFQEVWSLRADGGSGWTGIWETQSAGKGAVDAETVFLRFRFEGPNAQLWADPKHPIVVQIELNDGPGPSYP